MDKISSQSAISALIVVAVTIIGCLALIIGAIYASAVTAAFGIASAVVGGLLSALQPPGSLSNAIKNILPTKDDVK